MNSEKKQDRPVSLFSLEMKDRNPVVLHLSSFENFQEARDEAERRSNDEGVPRSLFAIGTSEGIQFPHLGSMMRLVNRYVSAYNEDFFWHDLYSMSKNFRGIWGLRETGTVFMPLSSPEQSSLNELESSIEYTEYYLKQKEHRWFLWTPEKVTRIDAKRVATEIHRLKEIANKKRHLS